MNRRPYLTVALAVLTALATTGCLDQDTSPTDLEALSVRGGNGGKGGGGGNGGGGGKTNVAFTVTATLGDFCLAGAPENFVSTRSATTSTTSLWTTWEGDGVVVKPAGSSVLLGDDASLVPEKKKKDLVALIMSIQDISGPDGMYHSVDNIPLAESAQESPEGFTLHVHADKVDVWRHTGHMGGPRVEVVGTICVGDIVYKPIT